MTHGASSGYSACRQPVVKLWRGRITIGSSTPAVRPMAREFAPVAITTLGASMSPFAVETPRTRLPDVRMLAFLVSSNIVVEWVALARAYTSAFESIQPAIGSYLAAMTRSPNQG